MNKTFRHFALGDVFDIYSPEKRFNANTVTFGGKYPYVARGSANNGIRGYITEDENYLSPAKTLSFGQDTATVFYQSSAYFTGDKIKVMTLKGHELNNRLGVYFTAVITKGFSSFAWGQNSFKEEIIKSQIISLPVVEHTDPDHKYTVDDIDWQYMEDRIKGLEEDRIKELEEDRIKELDIYLKATNLNDYELTDEDKKVLSLFRKSTLNENDSLETDCKNGTLRFKEFLLGDLFSSSTGDVDLQQKDVNGKGAFLINSGVDNHGIKGKTDRKAKIFSANTITIDFWGNAYYRDFEYKMATHNHVFSLTGKIIKNRLVGLYLIGQLAKLPTLFSYNNMATWNKLRILTIILPVTYDGEPDFDYMERYIRAIEKLTIADVVKYKNKVINTTKKLVNS